jgi:hypothetical protein
VVFYRLVRERGEAGMGPLIEELNRREAAARAEAGLSTGRAQVEGLRSKLNRLAGRGGRRAVQSPGARECGGTTATAAIEGASPREGSQVQPKRTSRKIRAGGHDVDDELLAHIWPSHHENVHFYGTHSVDIDGELAQLDADGYRPLRPLVPVVAR